MQQKNKYDRKNESPTVCHILFGIRVGFTRSFGHSEKYIKYQV